jgi:hypothetical protein
MSEPYDEQRVSPSGVDEVGVARGVALPDPTVSPEVLQVDHERCLLLLDEDPADDSSPLSVASIAAMRVRRR